MKNSPNPSPTPTSEPRPSQHRLESPPHLEEAKAGNHSQTPLSNSDQKQSPSQGGLVKGQKSVSPNISRPKGDNKNLREVNKLSSIIKNRKDLNQELVKLKYEEAVLKEKRKVGVDRRQRSSLSPKEIKAIHKALQARKDFEEKCDVKISILEQSIRQKQLLEEQQKVRYLQQVRKQKNKQSLIHIEKVKERQMERQKLLKEQNHHFQQVKKKIYPHHKLEEEWMKNKQKQEIKGKEVIQQLGHSRAVSMGDVFDHQKVYMNTKLQQEEQRRQLMKRQSIAKSRIEKATLSQFQPSKFLKTIFEEEKNSERSRENNKIQLRTLSLKKTEYANSTRKFNETNWKQHQLKPIKEKQLQKMKKESPLHKKVESKSNFQIIKLGNDYMREIHSSIDNIELQKSRQVKIQPQQSPSYQDYLTKMRLERQMQEKNNPQLREIKDFRSVMKKNLSLNDKFHQTKLIANRLQEKAGHDPKMMLASISAKLEMINGFI